MLPGMNRVCGPMSWFCSEMEVKPADSWVTEPSTPRARSYNIVCSCCVVAYLAASEAWQRLALGEDLQTFSGLSPFSNFPTLPASRFSTFGAALGALRPVTRYPSFIFVVSLLKFFIYIL